MAVEDTISPDDRRVGRPRLGTPEELFLKRRTLIQAARHKTIWDRFSTEVKTIFNVCFLAYSSDIPPNIHDLTQLQIALGQSLGISDTTLRREIAFYSREIEMAPANYTPSEKKVTRFMPSFVDHPEAARRGIIQGVSGNQFDFEMIYQKFQPKIYSSLYRLFNDPVKAADATQEVFLRAWGRLPRTEDPDLDVGSYLYTMAKNLFTDQYRRDQVIRVDRLDGLDEWQQIGRPDANLLDLETKDQIRQLYQAIEQLSPRYQWVIKLYDLDEFDLNEVAEIMLSTRSAMKSLHFRAKGDLAKLLKQDTPQ